MSSIQAIPEVRPRCGRDADALDVERIREQFPILREKPHGKPLIYFDNSASAQKPLAVLDELRHFYEHDYANVHRGVHALSERATEAYEAAASRCRSSSTPRASAASSSPRAAPRRSTSAPTASAA